jgi:hypothetical protein
MKKCEICDEPLGEEKRADARFCSRKCQRKDYKRRNRDKVLEEKKRYRERHKEKIREYKKQWREENKEKVADYRRKRQEKSETQKTASSKKYENKNPKIQFRVADLTPEQLEEYLELKRYKDRERKRKKYREDKEWREKEKKRNTANYRANKEWYHAYSTAYYKKNQERLDKYKYQQRLKQYKENPCVKLRDVTSGHVYYALKAVGSSKAGQSTTRHLPYTMDELRTHLESLFTPEMSWDNHGSYWHLDHIIPQAALPYDSMEHPNFIKCWALSNLQPLPASENISKGSLYEGKRYGKNKSQDT